MRQLRIHVLAAAICILFGVSVFTNLALARPIEPPPTADYAEFRNDPYPIGTLQMTIYVHRESPSTMYVYLLYPNQSEFAVWQFGNPPIEYQFDQTVPDVDGTWRLECYLPGYAPYMTDAALFHDKFLIGDPAPDQNNLATDWARNPQNALIHQKAHQLGNPVDSFQAAQIIYNHVLAHFNHNGNFNQSFRKDLELLSDLNTYGEYRGVCRSDAVILTSYARSLGIPARIIKLDYNWWGAGERPWLPDGDHYFAEFYVSIDGVYQWLPVDADPMYNWFGIAEANSRISSYWPAEYLNENGHRCGYNVAITIVTNIPHSNIIDFGYSVTSYPDPMPYRNDL